MPQEFHVIRCYSCSIFQVHQVKKKPKWQCKICDEKQSVKKVYGKGSGKECRLLVQSLNMTTGQNAANEDHPLSSHTSHPSDEGTGIAEIHEDILEIDQTHTQSSKWNRFCEDEPETSSYQDADEGEGLGIPSELISTERPVPLKRKKGQSNYQRASWKRSRFGENIDGESFQEPEYPQKKLNSSHSFYKSIETPSWDSDSTMHHEKHSNNDVHTLNARPTYSSSYKMNCATQQNEQFNHSQTIPKSSQIADGTRPQADGGRVFLNNNKRYNNETALYASQEVPTKSKYECTKVKESEKAKSTAAIVAPSSKWAVFANPDSDDDEGEDFGTESSAEFDISLDRVRNPIPEQCIDIECEEYSSQRQTVEVNDLANKAWSQEGDKCTFHSRNMDENQLCEKGGFRQHSKNKNTLPDSHQTLKTGVKKACEEPCFRKQGSSILNNIQNSLQPLDESRNVEELQVKETVKNVDNAVSATNELNPHRHIDKKKILFSFHVEEDVLEDLPDDFDVW